MKLNFYYTLMCIAARLYPELLPYCEALRLYSQGYMEKQEFQIFVRISRNLQQENILCEAKAIAHIILKASYDSDTFHVDRAIHILCGKLSGQTRLDVAAYKAGAEILRNTGESFINEAADLGISLRGY